MVEVKNDVLVTRNARDKIQIATFSLEQDRVNYKIKRFTGQFGGKITTQPEKIIERGKAARTPLQQAELEYNSLVKKCLDKGYKKLSALTRTKLIHITPEELDEIVPSLKTDSNGKIKPQLAKSSNDCTINVWEKPMFCSRKLDGVRCEMQLINDEIRTTSRGGGDYDASTTHIRNNEQLKELFITNPDLILDGELYIHGAPLQEISGLARLKTWEDKCSKLEYWVYDYVDTGSAFNERLDFLTDAQIAFKENPLVKFIDHDLLTGWAAIKKAHDKFVSEGYEGLVARKPNGKYSPGRRNSDWIKLKDYKEGTFEIIGWEEGLRPIEDMVFILKTKSGSTFKAKPIGNKQLKEYYIENMDDCIGQLGEVKYFEMSSDGIPLQPSFRAVRHDLK
jgi:hypothetical protein